MQVIRSFEKIPGFLYSSVMTMGNFDGLHLGHIALINCVINNARALDIPAVLLTFQPHPMSVLFPDHPFNMIKNFPEMIERLESLTLDYLVAVPFTSMFAQHDAHTFLHSVIQAYMRPRIVVVGRNHWSCAARGLDGASMRESGATRS